MLLDGGMGVEGTRVAIGAALGALLVAGCAATTSPEPSMTPPASPSSVATTETEHVSAGPIALDAPAGWHVREGVVNPSGNVTFAYLSPGDLPSECEDTGQGEVCHPWPISESVPGGIVVAVRLYGMPGSAPPSGGDPITVAGRPARRISGPADEACRAIGGSELIRVVVPAVPGTAGWVAFDACLAGADAAAEGAFGSIVASTMIVATSPSP